VLSFRVSGVTSGKFILATVLLDAFLHGQGQKLTWMMLLRFERRSESWAARLRGGLAYGSFAKAGVSERS
jgi:hypothetical protein